MGGWTDSRSSAQCGDAFEQFAAIADVGDAEVFQILARQSQEDRIVDMVLAKENLIVTIQGTRLSNGIRAVISRPRFSDAAFAVGDEDAHVRLRIRY
jgi:hypothetical protein